jgi:hypothetical protein
MATDYAYRHGEGWLSARTAGGEPDNFEYLLPEIDSLNLNFATSKIEHVSKRLSIAAKDLSIPYMFDVTGELVISAYSASLLRLAWFGTTANITAAAFIAANAIFPTGIIAGDIMPIPGGRIGISSLTIVDSTGSPITLTLGLHYEIVDADAGLVKFLDVTTGSVVQPFKAAGNVAGGSGTGILMNRVFELYGRFKMINIAKSDAKETFDFYKMQFDPTTAYQILGDGSNVSTFTLPFQLLQDSTKSDSATFGKYGRITQVA